MSYYLTTMIGDGRSRRPCRPLGYPLECGLAGTGIVYDRGDGPKLIRVPGPAHRSWVKLAEHADEPLSTQARHWCGVEGRVTFREAVGQWLRPQLTPTVDGRYEIWCGDPIAPLWSALVPLAERVPSYPLIVRDFWPQARQRECLLDHVGYLPTVSVLSLGLLVAAGFLPAMALWVLLGALPATDAFTNTAGTTLHAHNANWVTMSGADADMEIQNNAASPNIAGLSAYRWAGDTFDSNMYAQGIYSTMSGGASIGPAVRCQSGGHTLYGYLGSAAECTINRVTAGTNVTLGTGTGVVSSDAVKLFANGSTIQGNRNGSLDSTVTGNPFTDTNLTGGAGGLTGQFSNNSNQIDTWEAGNLVGALAGSLVSSGLVNSLVSAGMVS